MTSMRSFALTPGRLILLIVFFLISAIAALLVCLPANWVWSQVQGEIVLPPGVEVDAVGGTLWSGSGLFTVAAPGLPARALRLTWDLGLPNWEAGWPLQWRLESRQSWLAGEFVVHSRERVQLRNGRGSVALVEFSEIARQNGLTLPGDIIVQALEFQVDQNGLIAARGKGYWEGGPVAWQMGNQQGGADMPPLVADLRDQAGGLVLDIRTEAESTQLIDLALDPDGMASMAVRRRLLELSGMAAGNGSPSDTVFRLQTRVLP